MALTDLHLNSLISAVGTPGFENVLVDEMRRVVGVDHCAIFCGDKQGSALSVSITAGKISDSLAQDCAELYTHKLFHKDPLIGWGKLDNTALMPPQINRIGVDDLTDADYRDILYKRCKILEKLTLFHGSGENQYCLNLYRLNDRGPFSSREMESFNAISLVMSSLINKHILLGTPEKPEFNLDWVLTKLDRCCSDCLTKREIEICARIIIGYTSDTIAQDLHISANTVLSHRRNAYEKLNIRTQNQLFAILIDGLPKKGH